MPLKTETFNPQVGDFITETLVHDTCTHEVIGKTPKTIRIREAMRGEIVRSENRDGNPYPCVWHEAVSNPNGKVRTLRLRKDGTYRVADWANPMRPAVVISGKPISYTDYRE